MVSGDSMVLLAIIVSRSEAIVVASMLEAEGIFVHVGGLHHASVQVISVALGHYRISVPVWQYEDASAIVADNFGAAEWQFSQGLQTAVIKLFLAWFGSFVLMAGPSLITAGAGGLAFLFLLPLSFATMPVNPQGRSDYFLEQPFAK
jgi:hypothetical protein